MSVRYPGCLCVTSCFLNISLSFQDIQIFFSGKDSPDSQLQNLLSQNITITDKFAGIIISFVWADNRGPFLSVCYRPVFYA